MEQILTRELARLEEPFRSVLMHRYYDGLEPTEIGQRLGVPAGTQALVLVGEGDLRLSNSALFVRGPESID